MTSFDVSVGISPRQSFESWAGFVSELERDGVVTARRGRGMEVTEQAPALCRVKRQETVRGRIRQALREAVDSVLPPEEVRRIVEEELAAANGKRKPREKR